MNIIGDSGVENWRRRVYCGPGCSWDVLEGTGVKAERVSRWASWVVGAREGGGDGLEEEKPLMDQRTMHSSLAALERMRSP